MKSNFMVLANEAAGRRASARHQRRAEEAEARKRAKEELQGLSVSAASKVLRRQKAKRK